MNDMESGEHETTDETNTEINALISVPENELLLPEDYRHDINVLRKSLNTTYGNLTPELKKTYYILSHAESGENAGGFQEIESSAVRDTIEIAAKVTEYLTQYLEESDKISRLSYVSHLARMTGAAFRLHPLTIADDDLQKAITSCLITGAPIDLSDIVSTNYYLGPNAEGKGNELMKKYFEEVPFKISAEVLSNKADPVEDIIKDWYRAVTYCIYHEMPEGAILRDGTPLLRLAPDCIPWIKDHMEEFPGLDLLKVNDGVYVDQWLRNTRVGTKEGCASHRAWLTLLTGYTPAVNEYVGVDQRYSEAGLSAALCKTIDTRTT